MVLIKLAAAFELTLAGLFARAEYAFDRVTREKNQPVWRDPATGYVRRQIFARPDHPVEISRVMLPAGARVTLPAESYARIRQALWLIEGALVIEGASGRTSSPPATALPSGRLRRRRSPMTRRRPLFTSSRFRGARTCRKPSSGL